MDIQINNNRKLSHGALKILNDFSIKEDKRIIYTNFILQILKCFPLENNHNIFSCEIFDDEYLCQNFIISYNINEGRPYNGDIVSITKIIINILPNKGNILYCCEEIKLLEKSAKYLINPNNLKIISNKSKKKIINMPQENKNTKINSFKNDNYSKVNNKDVDIIKNSRNELEDNNENGNILEKKDKNDKMKENEIKQIEEINIKKDKRQEKNSKSNLEIKDNEKVNNKENNKENNKDENVGNNILIIMN